MEFVAPDREEISYADILRALLIALVPPLALVLVAALGFLPPVALAVAGGVVALPAGVVIARRVLEDQTDVVIPWWVAIVGVGTSCLVTPWASAWVVREILAGTFAGDDGELAPAPPAFAAPATELFHAAPPLELVPDAQELEAVPQAEPPPPAEPLPALSAPAEAAVPHAVEPPPAFEDGPLDPDLAFPLPDAAFPLPEPAAPLAAPQPAPAPEPRAVATLEPDLVLELDPRLRTEPLLVAPDPVVFETPDVHELSAPPAEEHALFLAASELEPTAAHDPFSTFWLDPAAPPPDGLTPGYLPPLTGLWRTPLGDTL